MLDLLKTVMGAVSTKDIVPVLTHFCLYHSMFDDGKGRIQGSNGTCYIDAPFDHPVQECTVSAARFLKAVEACGSTPEFGITPGGKLSVKHGRFKAYLPTLPATDYPRASQEGNRVDIGTGFSEALKRLKPFISLDASRVWSTSVLLTEEFMYATNNVIVARTPIQWCDMTVGLPAATVDRLIEIGTNPTGCFLAETSVSFEYGPLWLRSQLITEQWPNVADMLDSVDATEPVPSDLIGAVETLKHFCTNEKFPVINLGEVVKTDEGEQEAEYDGFSLAAGAFHADQLLKVLAVATHVNFSSYPSPCAFKGPLIEGLLMGVRK